MNFALFLLSLSIIASTALAMQRLLKLRLAR
jgi:hypothetical protein